MDLFLKILGGLFLFLIVVLLLAFFILRARLRSALSSLREMGENLAGAETPARIRLLGPQPIQWQDAAAVEAQAGPLRERGFEEIGGFTVAEIEDLRILALLHREDRIYAVVYEHPIAGVWLDLISRYEDGTSITYANTAQGGEADQRPGHGTVRDVGASPERLLERILKERPTRPMKVLEAAEFAPLFQKAHADEMDWRNSRGGPTEEEIRRMAEASGEGATDEEIEMTRQLMQARALSQLDEALRERFLAQTPMSVAEWEQARDRLVIIHDRLTPEMVAEAFSANLAVGDDEVDEDIEEVDADEEERAYASYLQTAQGRPARAAFEVLNESVPPGQRFEKIGTLTEPLPADCYLSPE